MWVDRCIMMYLLYIMYEWIQLYIYDRYIHLCTSMHGHKWIQLKVVASGAVLKELDGEPYGYPRFSRKDLTDE